MQQPLGAPQDIAFLIARLQDASFSGNGYLSLVSASQGVVMRARVHTARLDDLPKVVARDAFILLGGRVTGIVQGISERGDFIPEVLAKRAGAIRTSLDRTESHIGLTDPSKSAWRQIAARGMKEAMSGHWTARQAIGMQNGVLEVNRTIESIANRLGATLPRLGIDGETAITFASITIGILGYGEFAPDAANYPFSRTPGAANARDNSLGAILFASGLEGHERTSDLGMLVEESSVKFRQATAHAMWAPDPEAPSTEQARILADLTNIAMA